VPDNLTDTEQNMLVKRSLVQWFEERALERLSEKSERYGAQLGVQPKSIKVKNYKARWGSCAASGDISFNWRTIIAPHRIVDYVVIHELCHRLEHNHSPRYWRHVENVYPTFKECREWLRVNGAGLNV
jgi:predicted metal-dependent hydrolase